MKHKFCKFASKPFLPKNFLMFTRFYDDFLIFLLPFIVFALLLLIQRKRILDIEHWRGPLPWLVIMGLVLTVMSLLYVGFFGERQTGEYVPPHLENGILIKGKFK
jgi:NADH:ubiquinone oxidoreductase subunit 5 (subunit L)/multisubunit Na+/H+ antiporter MnhA subunit